jgi:hypothetical protein
MRDGSAASTRKEAPVLSSLFSFTPSPLFPTRHPRALLGLASGVACLIVTALFAVPAQAALISTGACNEAALSQPFAQWGDSNLYELVPGGDFEGSLSGWSLSGDAQRSPGSEPYDATGSAGAYSLALADGASAQSPFTCVNASYPSFRFFARNDSAASTLLVQVVYKTPLATAALPLGLVALSGGWRPSLPMLTGSVVTGALADGTTQVALRFTALTGASRIDDVYLDPRMR